MKKLSQLFLLILSVWFFGQNFPDLERTKFKKIEMYYSKNAEKQAQSLGALTDDAYQYFQQQLGFSPEVVLLVLNPDDWTKYSDQGLIYGMPHYNDKKLLIVASEENPFWKGTVPPLESLPTSLAENLKKTYTDPSGNFTMRGFFNLLAIHELGHSFTLQKGTDLQRKWLGELFSNIYLHTLLQKKNQNCCHNWLLLHN